MASSTSTVIRTKPVVRVLRAGRRAVVGQGEVTQREALLSFRLKGLVTNKIDLWKVSDRLNVNPSTIQKILEGDPISRSVTKKIEAAFHASGAIEKNGAGRGRRESNHSTVERMMEVYDLYKDEKSLRIVGKKLGLSYERVRQLLEMGSEVGLFKYRPRRPPILSREKILYDYRRFLTRGEVARANRISPYYLSKLMALSRITVSDLEAIRQEERKRHCLEQYQAVAASLGHHPTMAELLRSKSIRFLATKVRRLWGSFEAFRRGGLDVTADVPLDGLS